MSEMFYLGLMVGLIPGVLVIGKLKSQAGEAFSKWRNKSNACDVTLIKNNKVIKKGIGKFEKNSMLYFDGKKRAYDPENMGLTGRYPSVILYESGKQVSLSKDDSISPLTPEEYNTAIEQAMITGADNFIIKRFNELKMLLLISIGAGGIAAFLAWNLVENLI